MTSKTFTVEHIHCGSCEAAIRKALARVHGIGVVEAEAATNSVTVAFDESVLDEAGVAQRLTDVGYPVVA